MFSQQLKVEVVVIRYVSQRCCGNDCHLVFVLALRVKCTISSRCVPFQRPLRTEMAFNVLAIKWLNTWALFTFSIWDVKEKSLGRARKGTRVFVLEFLAKEGCFSLIYCGGVDIVTAVPLQQPMFLLLDRFFICICSDVNKSLIGPFFSCSFILLFSYK